MSGAGPRDRELAPAASWRLSAVCLCLYPKYVRVLLSFLVYCCCSPGTRSTAHAPFIHHIGRCDLPLAPLYDSTCDGPSRLRLPGDSSRRLVFRVPDCRAPARASATATLSLHTAVPRYSAVSPHLPAAASPLACATLCDASPRPSSFQPLASSFSPCSSCLLGLRFASRPRRPRFTLPPPASLT